MTDKKTPIWGHLLHLSYNMWEDRQVDFSRSRSYHEELLFDEALWNDITAKMSGIGMNMVIIDLGDGVVYDSHPEIAIKGAWSIDRLRTELERLRKLGLEPIPKLNFATTHDAWLGEYSRCVSTPRYYEVCANLIREVIEIFDTPRFFHLGMDEETAAHQRHFQYVVIRQFDLWWKDLYFYCDAVTSQGVRPWIWSDHVWHHPWNFFRKMPREVLQSNWYYGEDFSPENVMAQAYAELEAHGYDQVPTGSNHSTPRNFELTVEHARKVIDPSRLLGFLQAPWRLTDEEFRAHYMQSVDQVAAAMKKS